MNNKGFDTAVIADYKRRIQSEGRSYLLSTEDENTDECSRFYFVGKHEGREVVFDAVLYTLRLQYESELFEIAEQRAAHRFPGYPDETISEKAEEEIGMFIAEVIVTLQEEGEVQVQEHVELDEDTEFGIGIDAGLHVDEITPEVITRFITQFNDDKLDLDPLYYSFQTEPDEAE